MTETLSSSKSVIQFFSNPIVGVTGSIASVLGLLLAIYFYVASRDYRELRYFVHPARAVVVQAGQTSRLSITLDGDSVNQDVSAVQVAFWNEGNQSIKRGDVLRPLVIKTSPESPILEAEVRKRNRDVVEITLNRSRMDMGELEVDWNILEHHDGAILQLVYFGDAQVPVTATAIIEGQGEIEKMEYSGEIQSPSEQYSESGNINRPLVSFMLIILAVVVMVAGLRVIVQLRKEGGHIATYNYIVYIGGPLAVWVVVIYVLFQETGIHGPPFGF